MRHRATNSQRAAARVHASAAKITQIVQDEILKLSSWDRLRHLYALATGRLRHTQFGQTIWRSFGVLLFISLLIVAAPAWPQAVSNFLFGASGWRCSDHNVEINSLRHEDRESACAGAIDAKAFLIASGMNTSGHINISMVPKLADASRNAFGYFDRSTERIYVLNFEAARLAAGELGMYGEPMDRDLHRSIVVHEVAHLVAIRNLSDELPPVAALEYIAYVTQFATMPSAVRNRILVNNPSEGFAENWQINSFNLSFEPKLFAVRAYRHFMQAQNGAAFLKGLLSGEIQVGIPLPL